jgi:hypothetical protein
MARLPAFFQTPVHCLRGARLRRERM